MMAKAKHANNRLADNRKAFRDYFVLERLEAGLELQGTEVKSLKLGQSSLTGCYVRIVNSQAILSGLNIPPYTYGNRFNHLWR